MHRFVVYVFVAAVVIAGCGGQNRVPPRPSRTPSTALLVRVCGPYVGGRSVQPCHREFIAGREVFGPTVRVAKAALGPSHAARMTGVVWVCGNPFPKRLPPPIQDACTLQEGRTEVLDELGRVVARQRLREGRFGIVVPPGRYTLVTWNSGNGPWRQGVAVPAGQTAYVDVTILGM